MAHSSVQKVKDIHWLVGLSLFALILRLLTNRQYGFHRDEFLYIAQGKHLDWGFWSNPPGPGFFSALTQWTVGDSLFAIRLMPSLLGAITVLLAGLMARELGGKRFAQLLAGFSIIVSTAYPRVFFLYNPVPFDVFYWTLYAFLILRYLNSQQDKHLIFLGIAVGLGMLNKYSIVLFIVPLMLASLIPNYRAVWQKRKIYVAVGITLLIVLPNLIWQWYYGFPVFGHMAELSRNQLSNVSTRNFLLDQLLFNLSVLIIWLPGLYYAFFHRAARPYRIVAYTFLGTVLLVLLLKGKSYYTLGAYPMMLAAGACAWEIWTRQLRWLRIVIPLFCTGIFSITLPFSVPYLSLSKLVDYGRKAVNYGGDGILRWEDGQVHDLPQDFADMLGWEEMGDLVGKTYRSLSDQSDCFIYCQNFGQAGAVEYYGRTYGLPMVHSFADAYLLWTAKPIDRTYSNFIYVNDELGSDVADLFAEIQLMGEVTHRYARERGTKVYLCQEPKTPFQDFWNARVNEVRAARNLR